MGTTVTTNLGLIKPDDDESIKANLPTFPGWATQNGSNCDKIDALFRNATATYSLTWSAATPPTLGSGGFAEGKFVRLFPRMVLVYFRIFTGGTGFAVGSGGYSFNLPTGVASEFTTVNDSVPAGKAIYQDNSAAVSSSVFEVVYGSLGNNFFLRPPGGSSWSPTVPVVPAQNDRVSGYLLYPTADA